MDHWSDPAPCEIWPEQLRLQLGLQGGLTIQLIKNMSREQMLLLLQSVGAAIGLPVSS